MTQPPETTAKVELKPCPHCGNDGTGPIEEALHISMCEHDWRDPSWTVQCDKCTATMGYSDSEDEAAAAWNQRDLRPDDALRWPRLTEAMMVAAAEAHFGNDFGNIDGLDMTAHNQNWTFRQFMKRIWPAMKRAASGGT